MAFANDRIAKVWEIKPKEKYCEVKISTSRKDDDGEYKQDFSAYVRFVGKANEKARELKGSEMIKLLKVEVSNHYSEEKKITYYNPVCFDFEIFREGKPGGSEKPKEKKQEENLPPLYDDDDEMLPF